eukprot:1342045-Pyramimonas_sp.AAC.1
MAVSLDLSEGMAVLPHGRGEPVEPHLSSGCARSLLHDRIHCALPQRWGRPRLGSLAGKHS